MHYLEGVPKFICNEHIWCIIIEWSKNLTKINHAIFAEKHQISSTPEFLSLCYYNETLLPEVLTKTKQKSEVILVLLKQSLTATLSLNGKISFNGCKSFFYLPAQFTLYLAVNDYCKMMLNILTAAIQFRSVCHRINVTDHI